MAKPSSLTARDRDNLVAYLDGELDAQAARALEAKLARDPQARAEVEALKRSWELLDYLPRGEVSSQFTSRTLDRLATIPPATIAAADREPASKRTGPRLPRYWPMMAGWSMAMLAATALGFATTRAYWVRHRPNLPADVDAALVKDLRLLETKRQYDHVSDLNFLRVLDVSGLFKDEE